MQNPPSTHRPRGHWGRLLGESVSSEPTEHHVVVGTRLHKVLAFDTIGAALKVLDAMVAWHGEPIVVHARKPASTRSTRYVIERTTWHGDNQPPRAAFLVRHRDEERVYFL